MTVDRTNVVTRNVAPGPLVPSAGLREADQADDLIDVLCSEMEDAWQRGERPLAEEFLVRLPHLNDRPDLAVRLIYQEIGLRREQGEPSADAAVIRRFPQWREPLQALVEKCQPRVKVSNETLFPEVGEGLGDFHLLAELGRGALGRVFLAHQASLADRSIVLKMTPCHGREHLSLARLQHTHIVPLYWVQDYPARNLRVLCMPYLGGTAYSSLLERLRAVPMQERTGRHLVEALDRFQAESPLPGPAAGPARQFLLRASYVQVTCWLGACLAEALHYAHERALVHLDVKPSNVLLAADGTPMLLDFHLAHEPLCAGSPSPDWLGGTPMYLSPEQRAALASVRNRTPIHNAVDGRSDIYSLGLLLYEALAGELPGADARPLHRVNRQVSIGLSDIVARCLAADARQRYPDAAALMIDLRLHLTDQPLRGVPNRSGSERWRKWRRRRPYALMFWFLILAAGGALLTVFAVVRNHQDLNRRQVEAARLEGQHQLAEGKYDEAVRTSLRGLALVDNGPDGDSLKLALSEQLRKAHRAQAAHLLHQAADHMRFLVDPTSLARAERRRVESQCREVWETRHQILDRGGAELPEGMEKRLQTDLLDLALLWTELSVSLAPASDGVAARREALQVLAEAERLFGPSAALYRERQAFAEALGAADVAEAAAQAARAHPPGTPWEHHALARFHLRRGRLEKAAAEAKEAVRLQPQGFWPNFYDGVCAYRREDYERALRAFTVCIALSPENAIGYFNRARAWAARPDGAGEALRDYDRALQMKPDFGPAALNRGILHFRQQRYDLASADLTRALDAGADPAVVRYHLALVSLAEKNRSAALSHLHEALRSNPEYTPARELRDQLRGERPR